MFCVAIYSLQVFTIDMDKQTDICRSCKQFRPFKVWDMHGLCPKCRPCDRDACCAVCQDWSRDRWASVDTWLAQKEKEKERRKRPPPTKKDRRQEKTAEAFRRSRESQLPRNQSRGRQQGWLQSAYFTGRRGRRRQTSQPPFGRHTRWQKPTRRNVRGRGTRPCQTFP